MSVLSDLYRPHHQIQPDLAYGVCPASHQAAEYIQPHVHDGEKAALNLGLDLTPSSVLSDFKQVLIIAHPNELSNH